MFKLANPLHYPLIVLVSGFFLIIGVRVLGLSSFVIIPSATAISVVGAGALKAKQPDEETKAKKQLEQEINVIQSLAESLAQKAEVLRQEAGQLLTEQDFQLDLLIIVEQVCDRAKELPITIESLAKRIKTTNSLLSVKELEAQLQQTEAKLKTNSGIARQHLRQLVQNLEKNIQLAQTGKDTTQAQLFSLHNLIQESSGILQDLQNKLRQGDGNSSQNIQELHTLTQELNDLLSINKM